MRERRMEMLYLISYVWNMLRILAVEGESEGED
jgi:hypothetical protein